MALILCHEKFLLVLKNRLLCEVLHQIFVQVDVNEAPLLLLVVVAVGHILVVNKIEFLIFLEIDAGGLHFDAQTLDHVWSLF